MARALVTYTGPDQFHQLGAETFSRNKETLVTDEATIAEAQDHADYRIQAFPEAAEEPAPVVAAEPEPEPEPKPALPKAADAPKPN